MASSQNNGLNFPHSSPPPPSSPNGDSDSDSTVIVVVFVSLGSFFFLAFVLVALCCFIKKRKKKTTIQETENVHVDEHLKIKEATVSGPHGAQAVLLTIEDDVHIEEEIRKNEKIGQGLHAKSAGNIVGDIEAAESSSSSAHDHHLENKN